MNRGGAEAEIFLTLLKHIGENHSNLPPIKLTSFLPMVGKAYSGGLMVIGRSVNGWGEGWQPSQLITQSHIKQILTKTVENSTDHNRCPMNWVTDFWGNPRGRYSTRRSAFWRVIRRVVQELDLADTNKDSWPSCLAWSNLYKISPSEGGNPSSDLCNLQFAYCANLLKAELDQFSPVRALFLTGFDWAKPFLANFANVKDTKGFNYVKAIGTYPIDSHELGRIVVAVHPQGKKEDIWVDEVIRSFK